MNKISSSENNLINKNQEEIQDLVYNLLGYIGEDVKREGLIDTPKRVAKMYGEVLSGYFKNVKEVVNGAIFSVDYPNDEMVVVESIEYNSMCEHHMLPFVGVAHIAYIPKEKVIGLSKIPRIVDMFANRLQIQERLTNQVADALDDILDAKGGAVVFEGAHMCASIRGVKKHNMNMKTTAFRGAFITDRDLKAEFYEVINRK